MYMKWTITMSVWNARTNNIDKENIFKEKNNIFYTYYT